MTKILLVEDDKSLREIYGVRLLAEGYDIVSAGDGEEALAMAIKDHPQLIVSDVMMPKISGFDMLDILRSTTETKNIKVIMMTALSSEDQRTRGEALGADRYLVKSQVGIEDVVRTVHEVLGDAPVANPSGADTFSSTPAPSAVSRPATPTVPPRPASDAASQQQPSTPQPQPAAPSQPTPAPAAAPAPTSDGLPQPTAPFSTPRPASLGNRVIHPVDASSGEKPDLASLMEQELNQPDPSTVPTPPPQPEVPAQPATPPASPEPQPAAPTPSTEPQPTPPAPSEPSEPVAPTAEPTPTTPGELHGASDINFDDDETSQPAAPAAPAEPQAAEQPAAPANNPFDAGAEQPPRS